MRKLLCMTGLLLATTSGWAVDLVESYRLALQHDAGWQANQLRRTIDEQNLGIARSAILPVVGVNASYYRQYPHLDQNSNDQAITTRQAGISLQQPLFRWDVWQQYQKVQIAQRLSDLTLQVQHQQLMLDVATAYFNVLRQNSLLDVYKQEENTLLQQYQMIQAKYREGLVARIDMNEAQAQYQSTRARRVAGEVQSQLARQQLEQLTGVLGEPLATLSQRFVYTDPVPADPLAWIERATRNNLLINQRRAAYDIAAQQVKVDQADRFPQVNAVASTGWSHQDPTNPLMNNNGRADKIGVELNWVAFNSTRQGIIKKSRLESAAAYADIETTTRQIQTQTRQYYLQVSAANAQLQAYQTAMHSAQGVADAAQGSYREGLKTMVDVLLAQRNAFSARQEYVNAQYDYLLNVLNLKAVSGQLGEQDLQEINAWLR